MAVSWVDGIESAHSTHGPLANCGWHWGSSKKAPCCWVVEGAVLGAAMGCCALEQLLGLMLWGSRVPRSRVPEGCCAPWQQFGA